MARYSTAKPAGTPTWVDIMSPDPEASRAFYHAIFGWEYDIGGPEFGGYTTARLGDFAVAGIGGNPPGMEATPAAWNLYFATSDIDVDVAKATALGAKALYPTMAVGGFGSMATLADPTGAVFSFWQAGSHVGSQITEDAGSAAWYELYSPNAKQASEFYAGAMKAEVDPMSGGMEYYVLKHGEQMLAGIMQIDPSWGNFPAQWVTYFSVANVDETAALVAKHGGKQMGGIDDSPFGRLAAFTDPHGAAFKVVEPPKQ